MAAVEEFPAIIRKVLSEYTQIPYLNKGLDKEVLFDEANRRYMVVSLGFQNDKRVHNCVIHIDIIGDKVWIQRDNTDIAIARELEQAGIPKSHIVLGFHSPKMRPFTEYAVA